MCAAEEGTRPQSSCVSRGAAATQRREWLTEEGGPSPQMLCCCVGRANTILSSSLSLSLSLSSSLSLSLSLSSSCHPPYSWLQGVGQGVWRSWRLATGL